MAIKPVLIALVGLTVAASSCAGGADQATPQLTASTTSSAATPATAPTTTPTTAQPVDTTPVQDPAVSRILSGYGTWADSGFHSADDRALTNSNWIEEDPDAGRQQVSCAATAPLAVARDLVEFPALGFSADDVLPGLVVDGSAVETGNIRVLPLSRAPFTLRSSLASANPTTVVERPDSGTITQAVSALKRDADPRLGGIDVTGGDISYRSTETHSFEHSALEIGVSLRYRNRLVSAGLDTDYSQDTTSERHTITVAMTQRQFTLSMVDDAVLQPGDYFDAAVTASQVESLVGSGAIGSANPPLVIDRVNYGRMMHFTMSSTEVTSSQQLRAAVDAVKGRYEGSGTVDAEHLSVIGQSEISMVSRGGDQDLALAAIRSGDLSRFFGPSNPTTAAPLTFTFKTLTGSPVTLSETAEVQRLDCRRAPAPYEFALRIDTVQGRLRIFVNSTEIMEVTDNNRGFNKTDGSGTLHGTTLNNLLSPGKNEIRLRYTNLGCDNRFRVRVYDRSTVPADEANPAKTYSHPSPGCPSEGDMTLKFELDTTNGSITKL
jgi:hypothetical protein